MQNGSEIEADAAAMSSSKRHSEGSEDVAGDLSEAKRQRDDGDEEFGPESYGELFKIFWSSRGCKFDDITRGPMSHTDDVEAANGSVTYPCLEVYSCKVSDLIEGLEWPIHVFGLIAVHDSLDRKRNYIFWRERNDAQALTTAKDSFLVLTGPMRAINCHARIEFEVILKVRGKRQSEDKVLASRFFVYDPIGPGSRVGQVLTKVTSHKRCVTETKFGHFAQAVEATIEVKIAHGPSDFCGRFVACVDGFNEEVLLLDSGHGSVPVVADGGVKLSRRVVVVYVTGVLRLHVVARRGHCKNIVAKHTAEEDSSNGVDVGEARAMFAAQKCKTSSEALDVGFCKMVATISWSIPVL